MNSHLEKKHIDIMIKCKVHFTQQYILQDANFIDSQTYAFEFRGRCLNEALPAKVDRAFTVIATTVISY